MKRNIVFLAAIILVALVVTVVVTNSLRTPTVTNSDLVICGTQIVYGGSIVYSSNETTTTVFSGNFFPEETVTSTFTTNVTFSATPGYSTSISDLGKCTFTKT
ncbi:MAG: hypothetical protein OK457_06040 [Thaumarchaeota archaeon]|nr:hypothetical protein [Nitrososphaerota archaeon]